MEAALPDKPPAGADQPGGGLLPLEARERLQLLSGITGFNEPGVLLALMGGSGAGERRGGEAGHGCSRGCGG